MTEDEDSPREIKVTEKDVRDYVGFSTDSMDTAIDNMKIPFKSKADVRNWADYYPKEDKEEDEELSDRMSKARSRGHLTKKDLKKVAEWKSKRNLPNVKKNKKDDIKAISCAAFSTRHDRLRIGVLMLLHGVNWAMASVILHFVFTDEYPILDVRALETVKAPKTPKGNFSFNFEMWIVYTALCRKAVWEYNRKLDDKCKVTMRVLDRALWEYDKKRQQ